MNAHEQRIFDVLYQINLGLELISDADERLKYAALNCAGGVKAKESAAFSAALSYFRMGISLLPPDSWSAHYELSLKLYTEAAEAAYLSGADELRSQWLGEVFRNARNVLDSVKAYNIKIDAETSLNQLPAACATGLEVLRMLGIRFPARPGIMHVMLGLIRTKLRLIGRKTESLAELPELIDPYILQAMPILERLTPPAFMSGSQLFPLIVFKMVDLSVRYGNSEPSAFGYASFAITLSAALGDYEGGYRFGQMSWRTLQKHYSERFKVKVLFVLNTFIRHWKEHLNVCIYPLQKAYQTGLKVGNLVGGIWAAYYYLTWKFYTASPLPQLEAELCSYLDAFARYRQDAAAQRTSLLRQVMLNLMEPSADPITLSGTAYDESTIEVIRNAGNDKTSVFTFHLYKTMLAYLYGDVQAARANADACQPLLESVTGLPELTLFRFYEALTRIRAGELAKAKRIIKTLRKWSESAPQNYQHRYHLARAEYLMAAAKRAEARRAYDLAISGAKNAGYLQEEALACELAGAALADRDVPAAAVYLRKAVAAYSQWGAFAKAEALQRKYPAMNLGIISQSQSQTLLNSDNASQHTLDLTSVLRAATAISGAIRLAKLVEQLLEICIEHSGAGRAFLLLPSAQEWSVAAMGEVKGHEIVIMQGEAADVRLPQSIIQYTARTRETLVVDDAAADERFAQDSYVRQLAPKSVLCMPVINQSILTGILYLENNLATGVFTPKRTEVLKLLLGQIAVSLENARLYEHLEQKVAERTAELEEEKEKSDRLLRNILPEETASELKASGFAKPRYYSEVTVMFTDFVNFSSTVSKMSAEDLVAEIHFYYSAFDEIIARHGLEKIKTIGDSYMCAAGLPAVRQDGARAMVHAAMEMLIFLHNIRDQKLAAGKPAFRCRIGIHLGPVVAGIVGTRKFAYDIWGGTVNIASRLETASEPDRINISGDVYEQVKDFYRCSYRGKIEGKNVGLIDMFFVEEAIAKAEEQPAAYSGLAAGQELIRLPI